MNRKKSGEAAAEQPLKTTLAKLLELPEYSVSAGMRIEINSEREAVVENCRGILEYTPERVRLLIPRATVRFSGHNLCIGSMNKSAVVVSGIIESLEFSSLG